MPKQNSEDGQEKYTAQKNDEKEAEHEANKKATKVAAKAAADYFTGGQGGAVVDKLANTKAGNEILDKGAKVLDKTGVGKITKKLDDAGGLDAADKALSMTSAAGVGEAAGATSTSATASGTGSSMNSPKTPEISGMGKKSDSTSSNGSEKSADSSGDSKKSPFGGIGDIMGMGFGSSPLQKYKIIACIVGFCIIFFALSITAMAGTDEDGSGKPAEDYKGVNGVKSSETVNDTAISDSSCNSMSISSTPLSLEDFTAKLEQKAKENSNYKTFAENASSIYNIAKKNSVNPEIVVIRAALEGFSPGSSKNNYWGMGCSNEGGGKDCIVYSSFSDGVLGFVKNVSKYDDVESFMFKYSYIGAHWFSPGGASVGGCYYYPYIKQYLSNERSAEVASACSKSCSNNSCLKTVEEDQKAYKAYQVSNMIKMRTTTFNLGADDCENNSDDSKISGNNIGKEIADYAVKTFDSFSYSQTNRYGASSVDCSSLVARAYQKANISLGNSPTAADEYNWCNSHKKLISESELQAGDLIFFNKGSHYHQGRTNGIGHVAMYIGNNKQFAAHTSNAPQPDQVNISPYTKGMGNYFCRPYK